jgi:hypothetical protein
MDIYRTANGLGAHYKSVTNFEYVQNFHLTGQTERETDEKRKGEKNKLPNMVSVGRHLALSSQA